MSKYFIKERFPEVYQKGVEVLGEEKFIKWLDSPIIALNGASPTEFIKNNQDQVAEVLAILNRIEYGIYS